MNNYNIIRKLKERILKNFYPVYHAPLIFDINTQSCYRKAGYVAWPDKVKSAETGKNKEEKKEIHKSHSGNSAYFSYPKDKLKAG